MTWPVYQFPLILCLVKNCEIETSNRSKILLNISEPNNDSPLNVRAAELWSNQAEYKRVMVEKYNQATKSK